MPLKILFQKVKNILWHLPKSYFFSLFYGFPSKKLILIGITGTDGKTTTTHLINQILLNAGFKSEAISTINSPGLHTTSPDPRILQKIFKDMVHRQVTHVVVEVTAHALDQFRFWGCHFQLGIVTNITHEHLDDFTNLDSYTTAKSKLLQHSDICVVNKDDPSYQCFSSHISSPLTTYSINTPSDYQATNIKLTPDSLSFQVNDLKITTDSNYHYQIYNILAALIATISLKISPKVLVDTVKNFPQVTGRREDVPNNLGLKTIIDFAHTPNALFETLSSLKKITPGRVICIFGATGGRDQTKRPKMGEIVSQNSDIAIITADDTRHELVENINKQIIAGISKQNPNFTYYNIPNRQDAFNLAINLSQPGDTIVACGKGHETTILHGDTEYPWSEAEAFRTAFRLKNAKV